MLADHLHQILVEEDNPQAAPEKYHLPEAVHEHFRRKVLLYREANVLLALLKWAKKDPLFEQLLQEYERILFPASPTSAGVAKVEAVKAAMTDIDALVQLNLQRRLSAPANGVLGVVLGDRKRGKYLCNCHQCRNQLCTGTHRRVNTYSRPNEAR